MRCRSSAPAELERTRYGRPLSSSSRRYRTEKWFWNMSSSISACALIAHAAHHLQRDRAAPEGREHQVVVEVLDLPTADLLVQRNQLGFVGCALEAGARTVLRPQVRDAQRCQIRTGIPDAGELPVRSQPRRRGVARSYITLPSLRRPTRARFARARGGWPQASRALRRRGAPDRPGPA